MDFTFSKKVEDLQRRLRAYMDEYIYPNEQRFHDEIERNRWSPTAVMEELKPKARAEGLWNLFLPGTALDSPISNMRLYARLPHANMEVGEVVRIIRGAFAGAEGILERRKNDLRVVLKLEMLARSVSVEVDASEIEGLYQDARAS